MLSITAHLSKIGSFCIVTLTTIYMNYKRNMTVINCASLPN